ncbi:MAG: hypothetical protein JNM14_14495 [Ferruginibacter sp.]|nr:hypothetical protein [Ferruginibacter sp.]
MYAQIFNLVLPAGMKLEDAVAPQLMSEHDKIQCFSGTQVTKNAGITVQGSGASAQGHITGSLTTYDYKALYQVYNLKESESANYWFINYSKDTSHDELKKVAESSETATANYDLTFTLQGNDYGITSVFITYQVIRLVINGVTRDYVVTNNASSGAVDPSGAPYTGFKPIPAQ